MVKDVTAQVDEVMEKAAIAAAVFNQLDQEQTDLIVRKAFAAGFDARVRLAKMAAEETGLGIWEHKVLKNVLATLLVYENIAKERTVGVLSHDEHSGIVELAQPLGPIFAITPVTNPTSTVMFKILIALKTRNPIVISPHKRSLKCCAEAARLLYLAALAAGAPEFCVQCLTETSHEQTQAIAAHPRTALILATGGSSLVHAAYSSGTPAIGVGPGNVPVFVDTSADLFFAVESILVSKTFDNGTVCASEQAVVVEKSIAAALEQEFERQGAHFLSEAEKQKVAAVAVDPKTGMMTPEIVGQSVEKIASMAGIAVPVGTRLLIARLAGIGREHPLSGEVLAPLLGFFVAENYDHAIKLCTDLNYLGGIGHTVSIYANDERRVHDFATLMNAGRVLVNQPSTQGAVGGLFNSLATSFTLGCGSGGKNITTENISARNLLNIKRVCRRRPNQAWFRFDASKFLDESRGAEELLADYHRNT